MTMSGATAKQILGGDLRDVSLSSLLQLARAEGVSGWIRVVGLGEVGLLDGRVVGAQCGVLVGLAALRELLFHDAGRFAVIRGEPAGADIVDDVLPVVMDAYRLRDEWARVANAVLRRAPERPWRPTGGAFDAVVQALDGVSSLADLLARQEGVVITPLIEALLAALNDGVVERVRGAGQPASTAPPSVPPWPLRSPRSVVPPPPVPLPPAASTAAHPAVVATTAGATAATGPANSTREPPAAGDFFELMDRGHTLMRGEHFEAAEEVLRRALELRPGDRVVLQNLRALARRRGSHCST